MQPKGNHSSKPTNAVFLGFCVPRSVLHPHLQDLGSSQRHHVYKQLLVVLSLRETKVRSHLFCHPALIQCFIPRFPLPDVPLPDVFQCTYSDILISLKE